MQECVKETVGRGLAEDKGEIVLPLIPSLGSLSFFLRIMFNGVRSAMRGE